MFDIGLVQCYQVIEDDGGKGDNCQYYVNCFVVIYWCVEEQMYYYIEDSDFVCCCQESGNWCRCVLVYVWCLQVEWYQREFEVEVNNYQVEICQ